MSKGIKITIGVVVVLVVIGGGLWWWMMNKGNTNSSGSAMNMNDQFATSSSVGAQSATTTASEPENDSDEWINKQMSEVDFQASNFASDSASIDEGMNDQPVTQGQ